MENIKGLSLDKATVCPYLTDADKWIWITNSTFPSSPWEVFVVGDLLLGPRGWDPVRVWEGYRLGEWIPLLEMPPDNSSEWRTINFESVWFLPVAGKKSHEEHSCTSRGCQLTPVLEDSAVRENPAGKAGASSELFTGQVAWRADGHRGRRSTTLSHLPDWRPEATWCKMRHHLPSPCPFSSRPIHSPMVPQSRRICRLRPVESLASSFYTNLNPVVSQELLCELLTWPLPLSARKTAPSISGL